MNLNSITLSLLLLATGCDDPLIEVQTVTGLRVLGAKVTADSDTSEESSRSELTPGEDATLEWLVVSNRRETFTARSVLCRASDTHVGPPSCAAEPFDDQTLTGNTLTAARFAFALPSELEGPGEWLAWLTLCSEGASIEGHADALTFSCSDGGAARQAFYRGQWGASKKNRNPNLSDDELMIDGDTWAPADAALEPGAACGAELPVVTRGQSVALQLTLNGNDREAIENAEGTYAADNRESILLSQVATYEGLERPFSSVDFDAESTRVELNYTLDASAEVDPDGELVNVYFVARDERGGADWALRQLCILP